MQDTLESYGHIKYERANRVGIITLNRPEKLNAWTLQMEEEFVDVLGRTSADPGVNVLIVTGAGRGFCAGADFNAWDENLKGSATRVPFLISWDSSPEVPVALSRAKPVIAAINGPAIGVGLTMTLACDIRIASERATFSARFVKVGLVPECGSTRYLPMVTGLSNALYLALTGRIIDAQEAKARNLVDRIVPHERLMEEALGLGEEIASNPQQTVWAAKRLLHENSLEQDLRRVVTSEGQVMREIQRLPDHAEAVRAFLEKRPPRFSQ